MCQGLCEGRGVMVNKPCGPHLPGTYGQINNPITTATSSGRSPLAGQDCWKQMMFVVVVEGDSEGQGCFLEACGRTPRPTEHELDEIPPPWEASPQLNPPVTLVRTSAVARLNVLTVG